MNKSKILNISSNSWLVEIDDFFLQSSVSYYGLNNLVPHYSRASAIIKGRTIDISGMTRHSIDSLAESCRLLYGLLHQRYVITDDGIRRVYHKYQRGVYGCCPRIACNKKHLIPMGITEEPGKEKVKCWCPNCHDIYETDTEIDGAYFGPDLPIMFHKINNIPLKYKAFCPFLKNVENETEEVPEIPQRLYRWGEQVPQPE
ncbi:Casein kinase II regulatory subunit family protein [Histomonas meleagridis]|uniref:Casein kinase II regulatory subunit family protein n=1 Tax=Histomonas meleagridis TaxID=135588 RepID=UPI00355A2033|nr:Casein kinase II regulatory subunit family protein [Histomonas meleagridis]KAH0798008.1 Casein kinase II regulatory subunit family protein [Histomonas meleagridis]